MNSIMNRFVFSLVAVFLIGSQAWAEPILTSWFTDLSGKYARIYTTTATQNSQSSVTTWSRGEGVQSLPTYAGVSQISYTATDIYIRTTNLPFHIMGPWYGNEADTQLFPNYPSNQAIIYRIPRTPTTPPVSKTATGAGAIGFFVDGVSMFDNRDTFSYINSSGTDGSPGGGARGDGVWNRDAYINEGITFDPAFAHQAGGTHHYHANCPGLRHLLGDSVDYTVATNSYTENFNGQHSPILGWARDGYPVYGPYGYDDPDVAGGTVRRMISGYQRRSITTRTTLPQWTNTLEGRTLSLLTSEYGPSVSAQYPVGHYLEDYEYRGDTGDTLGTDFDLDIYNGRQCKTPEFPDGVYAYFITIETDGTPAFPYILGRTFYGSPSGSTATSVPAGAEVYFEGGPNKEIETSIVADAGSGDVTLTWSSVEGGNYTVQNSEDQETWGNLTSVVADDLSESVVDSGRINSDDKQFYQVNLSSLASYDSSGFSGGSGGNTGGSTVTLDLEFGTSPPPPPINVIPTAVTVNGQTATFVARTTQYIMQVQTTASAPYTSATATFPGPAGTQTAIQITAQ